MPLTATTYDFLGTSLDDDLRTGFENANGVILDDEVDQIDFVNGREGDDEISTGLGNDLAAGDMVGDEWSYDGTNWVYDASKVVASDIGAARSYDDSIVTGEGNDVLLGNGGHDYLEAGAGNDTVNAGTGADHALGGEGRDILNLEAGNDYAEGGHGADIINGGAGDDVIWGDVKGENILKAGATGANTFSSLTATGGWTYSDDFGQDVISQSAATEAGETYTISFQLAANLAGGQSSAAVEVLWNGAVVETIETTSGAYTTYEVDVVSGGEEGELSFRAVAGESDVAYNFGGPITSYESTLEVAGEEVDVAAFAPGQSKLYQVIDGQLHVLDTDSGEYTAVGGKPKFKINATGFNVEDDLIYGVAKSSGKDSQGNKVKTSDIVAIDANGDTYLIGKGFYGDYVGDFDDAGNLWTFHTSLNRLSIVDVSERDEDGNPAITHISLPNSIFQDRTYDLAFDTESGCFFAVVAPTTNGGEGKVVKIDLGDVQDGGLPTFTEVAITGTLYDGIMEEGMSKGAYGAVFMDGDSNLYFGLNKGDHDLNGSTKASGGIYKVNVDWDEGTAYAEFMTETPSTSSNDGTVDPRSSDAFATVDAEAAVLLREATVTKVETLGGDDSLRGGEGDDEIHGNAGDDEINGGEGDDALFGDEGADAICGADGDDDIHGGDGDDKMRGQDGDDTLSGDAGNDYLEGGLGDDQLSGGEGVDKIVGGTGADVIEGGAGNDNIWGGDWTGDDEADTFVFASGCGKDMVFDFETECDLLDFSALETDYASVMAASTDQGWATIIDISALDMGAAGDKLILKSVDMDQLGLDSFIF